MQSYQTRFLSTPGGSATLQRPVALPEVLQLEGLGDRHVVKRHHIHHDAAVGRLIRVDVVKGEEGLSPAQIKAALVI